MKNLSHRTKLQMAPSLFHGEMKCCVFILQTLRSDNSTVGRDACWGSSAIIILNGGGVFKL
jgi:hypothetical protein